MSEINNLNHWQAMARPPKGVLKQITGGRLKGMTDIAPVWRYQVMTEQFGSCGIGWKYDIIKLWTEPAPKEQVFAFAKVEVYLRESEQLWSAPIPGVGGSMLIVSESAGLHANDEAFKMAITDALSVALKMLGVAADIHLGLWDGSKYKDEKPTSAKNVIPNPQEPELMTGPQRKKIYALCNEAGLTKEQIKEFATEFKLHKKDNPTSQHVSSIIDNFDEKLKLFLKKMETKPQPVLYTSPEPEAADRGESLALKTTTGWKKPFWPGDTYPEPKPTSDPIPSDHPRWTISKGWATSLKGFKVYDSLIERLKKYPEFNQDDIEKICETFGPASPDDIAIAVKTDDSFLKWLKRKGVI